MDDTNAVEEFVDRIASHPDDPDAPFADRLLLALGVHPNHVTGPAAVITEDDAVAIAAHFRSDAHRYPMVCEDYGTQRDEAAGLGSMIDEIIDGSNSVYIIRRADGQDLGWLEGPWQVVTHGHDFALPEEFHAGEADDGEPPTVYEIIRLHGSATHIRTIPNPT